MEKHETPELEQEQTEEEDEESVDESQEDESSESEDESQDDDSDELKQQLERANAEAAKWRRLAKKKQEVSERSEGTDFSSLVKNLVAIKDLEPQEIEALHQEADDLGVEPVKYIQSNAGKAHLANIRQERKSKQANPSTSSRSQIYKKYTAEDMKKMNADELRKILSQ